jgi:hypothetical protein
VQYSSYARDGIIHKVPSSVTMPSDQDDNRKLPERKEGEDIPEHLKDLFSIVDFVNNEFNY